MSQHADDEATTTAPAPPEEPPAAEAGGAHELGELQRTMRMNYARIALAVLLYCAYATLHISAVLTDVASVQSPYLMALFIGAILALPRKILSAATIESLPTYQAVAWAERAGRIKRWMVWTRAIFLLGAIFLFIALPDLI